MRVRLFNDNGIRNLLAISVINILHLISITDIISVICICWNVFMIVIMTTVTLYVSSTSTVLWATQYFHHHQGPHCLLLHFSETEVESRWNSVEGLDPVNSVLLLPSVPASFVSTGLYSNIAGGRRWDLNHTHRVMGLPIASVHSTNVSFNKSEAVVRQEEKFWRVIFL